MVMCQYEKRKNKPLIRSQKIFDVLKIPIKATLILKQLKFVDYFFKF